MEKSTKQKDFTPLEHRYLDERFESLEKMILSSVATQDKVAALTKDAADRALQKAEALAAHNQAISNEFRGQLKDQAETLMSRLESLSKFQAIEDKIELINKEVIELREFRSSYVGAVVQRSSSKVNNQYIVGAAIAIAGIIISIAVFFKKDCSRDYVLEKAPVPINIVDSPKK